MSAVEKLLILSGTLWLVAIALAIYVWIMHARQRAILHYIAGRLAKIEQALTPPKPSARKSSDEASPKTVITINKNEPLSKYEKVTLPDNIDINFVD